MKCISWHARAFTAEEAERFAGIADQIVRRSAKRWERRANPVYALGSSRRRISQSDRAISAPAIAAGLGFCRGDKEAFVGAAHFCAFRKGREILTHTRAQTMGEKNAAQEQARTSLPAHADLGTIPRQEGATAKSNRLLCARIGTHTAGKACRTPRTELREPRQRFSLLR